MQRNNNLLTFRFPRPTSRRYECDNRRPLKGKHISCSLFCFFLLNNICHSEIYIVKEALDNDFVSIVQEYNSKFSRL